MVCRFSSAFVTVDVTGLLQSLKAEFEQHDAYMAELEKDVATFLEQGKLNAANRLENQLAILKVFSVRIYAIYNQFEIYCICLSLGVSPFDRAHTTC